MQTSGLAWDCIAEQHVCTLTTREEACGAGFLVLHPQGHTALAR